jgi:glycosyltransferase involved in cell wall biosynthesis
MKVSAVITAYNKGPYIRECLLGVLNQDFDGDMEIIVVDDCSTDDTREVIESLSAHPNFNKVKYTRHDFNKGLMGNFIWALTQAKGEYVCFCDGDDFWISNQKISNQISFLRNHIKYSGCGMLMDIVDSRNEIDKLKYSDLHFTYDKNTDIQDHEILDFIRFPFGTSTFMFRRSFLELSEISKFNFVKVSNDYVLFVLLNQRGKLFYLNQLSVKRNHNDNGVTSEDHKIQIFLLINNFLMFKRLRQMLERIEPSESNVILKSKIVHLKDLIIRKYGNRDLGEFFKNFRYYRNFKNSSILLIYLLTLLPSLLIRKIKLKLS